MQLKPGRTFVITPKLSVLQQMELINVVFITNKSFWLGFTNLPHVIRKYSLTSI